VSVRKAWRVLTVLTAAMVLLAWLGRRDRRGRLARLDPWVPLDWPEMLDP